MLSTGIRTPVGVKVFGTDLAEMEKVARADRGRAESRARHVERLRRAGHRRLLSRHRARPDALGRYGLVGRRRAGRDRDGARRRDRDHDRRGPRALRRQHPLSARPAREPAGDRHATCRCRCRAAASVPLGEVAKRRADARRDLDPHRERPARGLHLRRHRRPRPRRLCRRRAAGGRQRGQAAARLFRRLERAVRISGARRGAAEDRRAGDAALIFLLLYPQLPQR